MRPRRFGLRIGLPSRCLPAVAGVIALLMPLFAPAASPAPFDLAGPTLHVLVTRGNTYLPASQVPSLAEGDKLWIKPEFPKSQSARYLMVAAFLRGSTNPPPEDWFFPCKTWTSECKNRGLTVTVPEGAQQVLIFLAPETNGDLKSLINAVRGRPGAFVRSTQELNQVALDRSRLDAYLDNVNKLNWSSPNQLSEVAPLLARSLSVKVDAQCLEKRASLQASCLTAGKDSLILADGHSMTLSRSLTEGAAADLVLKAAALPEAGAGAYSPYVSSVLDIVRIFDSFRTAQYEYIPALVTHRGDQLALTLNAVPSFYDPKSVLVVALPSVEPAQPPPLRAVNPQNIYCASRSELVLPVTGAPLVYSTAYAHDVSLNLQTAEGQSFHLRAQADPARGGYVVNTRGVPSGALGSSVQGRLRGFWGFDTFEGPVFELRNAQANAWALAKGDEKALIVGREDTVHLQSAGVSCVDEIMLRDPDGKELRTQWKAVGPNEVEVTLPLQNVNPGPLTLLIGQSGMRDRQSLPLTVFSAPSSIDEFKLHAGDTHGVLVGTRLDEVASLSIGNLVFSPGELNTEQGRDRLTVHALDAVAATALDANKRVTVMVTLEDGRTITRAAIIGDQRPSVELLARSVLPSESTQTRHIELSGPDEIPHDARLSFSLRAISPKSFARDQVFEVATQDETFSTTLSLANGAVRLENSRVALVTFNPAKAFGFSAFGPLKLRTIAGDTQGDWQPLATLVRLPALQTLSCPYDQNQACRLSGADLFLIEAISADPQFRRAVAVPDGFPGAQIVVPQPEEDRLYVRLRDNPSVANVVTLPVSRTGTPPQPPAPEEARDPVASGDVQPPPDADGTTQAAPSAGTASVPTPN